MKRLSVLGMIRLGMGLLKGGWWLRKTGFVGEYTSVHCTPT